MDDQDTFIDNVIDDEDDYDPIDPYRVQFGLEKAILGLSVALDATDDEEIKNLLEQAFPFVAASVELNNKKLEPEDRSSVDMI